MNTLTFLKVVLDKNTTAKENILAYMSLVVQLKYTVNAKYVTILKVVDSKLKLLQIGDKIRRLAK